MAGISGFYAQARGSVQDAAGLRVRRDFWRNSSSIPERIRSGLRPAFHEVASAGRLKPCPSTPFRGGPSLAGRDVALTSEGLPAWVLTGQTCDSVVRRTFLVEQDAIAPPEAD